MGVLLSSLGAMMAVRWQGRRAGEHECAPSSCPALCLPSHPFGVLVLAPHRTLDAACSPGSRSLASLRLAHLHPCFAMWAGSTDTSLWTHYKAGAREYCGNTFPDGMHKNDRLAQVPACLLACLLALHVRDVAACTCRLAHVFRVVAATSLLLPALDTDCTPPWHGELHHYNRCHCTHLTTPTLMSTPFCLCLCRM